MRRPTSCTALVVEREGNRRRLNKMPSQNCLHCCIKLHCCCSSDASILAAVEGFWSSCGETGDLAAKLGCQLSGGFAGQNILRGREVTLIPRADKMDQTISCLFYSLAALTSEHHLKSQNVKWTISSLGRGQIQDPQRYRCRMVSHFTNSLDPGLCPKETQ